MFNEYNPGALVFLYYQRADGYIYEARVEYVQYYNVSHLVRESRVVQAKLGSPISAFAFTAWDPVQIRLYYLDDDNSIREHRWLGNDSGWASGGALPIPAHSIAANSRIASCGWGDANAPEISVFYQDTNQMINTLRFASGTGWSPADRLVRGCSGSSLAASHSVDVGIGVTRLYCQSDANALIECTITPFNTSCFNMTVHHEMPAIYAGASITSLVYSLNSPTYSNRRRLYFMNAQNSIQEVWHFTQSNLGWCFPSKTTVDHSTRQPAAFRAGTRLAVVFHADQRISLFCREPDSDHFIEIPPFHGSYGSHLKKLEI